MQAPEETDVVEVRNTPQRPRRKRKQTRRRPNQKIKGTVLPYTWEPRRRLSRGVLGNCLPLLVNLLHQRLSEWNWDEAAAALEVLIRAPHLKPTEVIGGVLELTFRSLQVVQDAPAASPATLNQAWPPVVEEPEQTREQVPSPQLPASVRSQVIRTYRRLLEAFPLDPHQRTLFLGLGCFFLSQQMYKEAYEHFGQAAHSPACADVPAVYACRGYAALQLLLQLRQDTQAPRHRPEQQEDAGVSPPSTPDLQGYGLGSPSRRTRSRSRITPRPSAGAAGGPDVGGLGLEVAAQVTLRRQEAQEAEWTNQGLVCLHRALDLAPSVEMSVELLLMFWQQLGVALDRQEGVFATVTAPVPVRTPVVGAAAAANVDGKKTPEDLMLPPAARPPPLPPPLPRPLRTAAVPPAPPAPPPPPAAPAARRSDHRTDDDSTTESDYVDDEVDDDSDEDSDEDDGLIFKHIANDSIMRAYEAEAVANSTEEKQSHVKRRKKGPPKPAKTVLRMRLPTGPTVQGERAATCIVGTVRRFCEANTDNLPVLVLYTRLLKLCRSKDLNARQQALNSVLHMEPQAKDVLLELQSLYDQCQQEEEEEQEEEKEVEDAKPLSALDMANHWLAFLDHNPCCAHSWMHAGTMIMAAARKAEHGSIVSMEAQLRTVRPALFADARSWWCASPQHFELSAADRTAWQATSNATQLHHCECVLLRGICAALLIDRSTFAQECLALFDELNTSSAAAAARGKLQQLGVCLQRMVNSVGNTSTDVAL